MRTVSSSKNESPPALIISMIRPEGPGDVQKCAKMDIFVIISLSVNFEALVQKVTMLEIMWQINRSNFQFFTLIGLSLFLVLCNLQALFEPDDDYDGWHFGVVSLL